MDARRVAAISASSAGDVCAAIATRDDVRLKLLLRLPRVQMALAAAAPSILNAIVDFDRYDTVSSLQRYLPDLSLRVIPAVVSRMTAACRLNDMSTLQRLLHVPLVRDSVTQDSQTLRSLLQTAVDADAAACIAVVASVLPAGERMMTGDAIVHAATFRRTQLLHTLCLCTRDAMAVALAVCACMLLQDQQLLLEARLGPPHTFLTPMLQPVVRMGVLQAAIAGRVWRFPPTVVHQLASVPGRKPTELQLSDVCASRQRLEMPPRAYHLIETIRHRPHPPLHVTLAHLGVSAIVAPTDGSFRHRQRSGMREQERAYATVLATDMLRFYAWARRAPLMMGHAAVAARWRQWHMQRGV